MRVGGARGVERRRPALLAMSLAAFGWGCGAPLIETCEAEGDARPVCEFRNPEDLALLPDGARVLVSEFGALDGSRDGWISVYDTATGTRRVLFRGGDAPGAPAPWGDPACPGPPERLSPHGIHLGRRPDGAWQLAVVQHAGRESIELFEVERADQPEVALAWRGCLLAPDTAWLNDVVTLPDGGLLFTRMLARREGVGGILEMIRGAALGADTGWVIEWTRDGSYRELPGTRAPLANGIELSRDGRWIYLNVSGANEVRRIDRETGEIAARGAVPGPDNSTWAPDGSLLVASLTGGLGDLAGCQDLESGQCGAPFEIVALDPDTLARRGVLYRGEGRPPMGGGTVGLRVGDDLLIGTFAGDRILRVAVAD